MATARTKLIVTGILLAFAGTIIVARKANAGTLPEVLHVIIDNGPSVGDGAFRGSTRELSVDVGDLWSAGEVKTLTRRAAISPPSGRPIAQPNVARAIDEIDPWTSEPIIRTTPALNR